MERDWKVDAGWRWASEGKEQRGIKTEGTKDRSLVEKVVTKIKKWLHRSQKSMTGEQQA